MTQLGIFCGPEDWVGKDQGGDTKNTLDVEQHVQALGGPKFPVQRHYNTWPQPGVPQKEKDAVLAGRNVYVEIAADADQGVTHASVAAGNQDAVIAAQGEAYKAWWNGLTTKPADRFYFVYQHEADTDPAQGSATDFKAAFKRYTNIWRQLSVPCKYVFNIDGAWGSKPDQWIPDPATFDLVGADRYNRGPVAGAKWRSFEELMQPAYDAAVRLNKPLCVGEVGCAENPNDALGPQSKPAWFDGMATTCLKWGNVEFICYTHKSGKSNYRISSTEAAANAFVDAQVGLTEVVTPPPDPCEDVKLELAQALSDLVVAKGDLVFAQEALATYRQQISDAVAAISAELAQLIQ